MTFGEKVRAARKERGLPQKELAARTGIAVRTIINYESGSRMPKSKDSYVRLAEVLDSIFPLLWMKMRNLPSRLPKSTAAAADARLKSW